MATACCDLVDADAARGQRVRIDLHAHRVLLLAEHLHLRDAVDRRDALREIGLGVLVDRRERQRRRGEREEEHRESAGFTLRKDGGVGIVAGSWRAADAIAELHVLRGGVDVAVEVELERDRASTPWPLTEVIESMPAMVENCFSSSVATAEAIVSGLAPGSSARHLDRREVDVRQRR